MIPPVLSDPNNVATGCVDSVRRNTGAWRDELRTAIRSAGELCAALGIDLDAVAGRRADSDDFPVLVPRSFVARMRHGDGADPLLRQVLALEIEHEQVSGFVADPLSELKTVSAGVMRKYARRALMLTTAACPVHCRYCFRRHFPYSEQLAARNAWEAALESLRATADVEEVILSGGDPLTLSTAKLTDLIEALEGIESVTTLRLHTRFPIIIPSRVTAGLLRMLEETRLRTVVVVHSNHANELRDPEVAASLRALAASTDLLLNQSVLLGGVNDNVPALCELSRALFDVGVTPYYLHMLDPVAGSAHFTVPRARARTIMRQLRAELPGYLVPRLVREDPGALSKTPVY